MRGACGNESDRWPSSLRVDRQLPAYLSVLTLLPVCDEVVVVFNFFLDGCDFGEGLRQPSASVGRLPEIIFVRR